MSDIQLYQPINTLMSEIDNFETALQSRTKMLSRFLGLDMNEAASLGVFAYVTGLNPLTECYYHPGQGPRINSTGVRAKALQYCRVVHGSDLSYRTQFVPATTAEADFDPDKGDIAWRCILTDPIETHDWERSLRMWIDKLLESGLDGAIAVEKAELYAGPKPTWEAVGVVDHREHFSGKEVAEWKKTAQGKSVPAEFARDPEGNIIYQPEMWDRNERAKKRAETNALKKKYPEMLLPDYNDVATADPQLEAVVTRVIDAISREPKTQQPAMIEGEYKSKPPQNIYDPDTGTTYKAWGDEDEKQEIVNLEEQRPWKPELLKTMIHEWANEYGQTQKQPVNPKQRGAFVGQLTKAFGSNENRYAVCKYLTGKGSSKDIPDSYMRALWRWFDNTKDEETGEWIPSQYVAREASSLVDKVMKDQGQLELIETEE